MKLAIIGWRPWSVAQAYKSLIINAKRLGHQVFGIVTDHFGDGPTTASLFHDLGVPTGDCSNNVLDKFNPDAVFGECFWGQEKLALEWAKARGKRYFALDHGKITGTTLDGYNNVKPPSTMLTVNETNARVLEQEYGIKAVPVGLPNFDLDFEINKNSIKKELGVTNQATVGLFLDMDKRNYERLDQFLVLANKKKWKVFGHLHPEEQGRKFKHLDMGHPRYSYLMTLQDRGVTFVSCIPGNFNGLKLKHCGPIALMRFVDIVSGDYVNTIFNAYAVGKKYFWIVGREDVDKFPFPCPHLVISGPEYKEVIEAVEGGTSSIVQDPEYVRRWFYKLDGRSWERILGLLK